MKSFFISKVIDLIQRLPAPKDDPLKFLKKIMHNRACSLNFSTVHPDNVLKIIRSLKCTKSEGLDFINMELVKLIADDVLPSLTHLVNLSISSRRFPSEWKVAKVVPLLKKGSALDPQNYRPVSLLPALSKILEKVIFNQIVC